MVEGKEWRGYLALELNLFVVTVRDVPLGQPRLAPAEHVRVRQSANKQYTQECAEQVKRDGMRDVLPVLNEDKRQHGWQVAGGRWQVSFFSRPQPPSCCRCRRRLLLRLPLVRLLNGQGWSARPRR